MDEVLPALLLRTTSAAGAGFLFIRLSANGTVVLSASAASRLLLLL